MIEQVIFQLLEQRLQPLIGKGKVFLAACRAPADEAVLFELRRTDGDGVYRLECTIRCLARTADAALRMRAAAALEGRLGLEGWTGVGVLVSNGLRWLADAGRFDGWAVYRLTLAKRAD